MTQMNDAQKKIYELLLKSRLFDGKYYLNTFPDVANAKMDPLEHYVLAGDKEGRSPNPFFNPTWYRLQMGVALGQANTLAHYFLIGDKQNVQPVVGLDPEYVKQQVPSRSDTALQSYIEAKSFKTNLNPNPFFDYEFYISQNPDIKNSELDPYIHFIGYGAKEGRLPSKGFSWSFIKERFNLEGSNDEVFKKLMLNWRRLDWSNVKGQPSVMMIQDEVRENHRPSSYFEAPLHLLDKSQRRNVDVYAFYLPQFHRIPENDQWWGSGFTEWHNVVRGMPRFKGHYQPRIPADLGFYDLDDVNVIRKQADLARNNGVDGFAFYYYNFGNKRLLEKPLNHFKNNSDIDLGYFLIWANETWSRRWDGSEQEILIEQTYPKNLLEDLAGDFSQHFLDSRYKTINGRPLVVIYRASQLPDSVNFIKSLRKAIKKKGFDPLIYMAQTFEDDDFAKYGLDGAMEFPPHKLSRNMQPIAPEKTYQKSSDLRVYSYDKFVEAALAEKTQNHLIRSCFPSWDNDGRRQGSSSVVHDSTPEKFSKWLGHLISEAESNKGAPNLVCINAWNEWGEGAYLEPDRRYGHAYLNVVQRLKFPEFKSKFKKIVLVGHDAFPAGAQRLLLSIGKSLKEFFNTDIAFVLLRADQGYDGLLSDYQSVAPVYVVDSSSGKDLFSIEKDLRLLGFSKAIFNTSISAQAAISFKKPHWDTIMLVHELHQMIKNSKIEPILEKLSQDIQKVVAPSQKIQKLFQKILSKKSDQVLVRHQGMYKQLRNIDPETNLDNFLEYLGKKTKPLVVVGIGYADYRKGIDIFVQTCKQMSLKSSDVCFIWQGDWDQSIRKELFSDVEKLTESGNLILVSNDERIEEVLNVADVYFLSSREDPMPSVAFEAWSLGLPVLAINGSGGIADSIAVNPFLGAVSFSTVPQIVTAIEKVSKSTSLLKEKRKKWVEKNCDWLDYIQNLMNILFSLPKVDNVIVGYNHSDYAVQAVGSLLKQSYPIHRVQYFDIASNQDNLVNLKNNLTRYSAQVDLVPLPKNNGRLCETWLNIFKNSDAEYVHILEGDDLNSVYFLEKSILELEKNKSAAICFSDILWADNRGNLINQSFNKYVSDIFKVDLSSDRLLINSELMMSDIYIKNPILSLSSVVFRRKLLLDLMVKNMAYFDKLNFAFDWVLYILLVKSGVDFFYLRSEITTHTQHNLSMSKGRNHFSEVSRVYKLFPSANSNVNIFRAKYLKELG